jgi:hypothetical protein
MQFRVVYYYAVLSGKAVPMSLAWLQIDALHHGSSSMLSEAQLAHLEQIVHNISAELHIDEAMLEAQQTLTLVLCNETICFRPLHITAQEVDIAAALAGQPAAQQALQERLRSAFQGLV